MFFASLSKNRVVNFIARKLLIESLFMSGPSTSAAPRRCLSGAVHASRLHFRSSIPFASQLPFWIFLLKVFSYQVLQRRWHRGDEGTSLPHGMFFLTGDIEKSCNESPCQKKNNLREIHFVAGPSKNKLREILFVAGPSTSAAPRR